MNRGRTVLLGRGPRSQPGRHAVQRPLDEDLLAPSLQVLSIARCVRGRRSPSRLAWSDLPPMAGWQGHMHSAYRALDFITIRRPHPETLRLEVGMYASCAQG